MKICVHYPTSEQGCAELATRVAEVYADIAVQYIDALPCSVEQKLVLIDELIATKKQGDCAEN